MESAAHLRQTDGPLTDACCSRSNESSRVESRSKLLTAWLNRIFWWIELAIKSHTAYCTVGKHEDKSTIHPPLVTRSQLRRWVFADFALSEEE